MKSKNNNSFGRKKLPTGERKKVIRIWVKEKNLTAAKKQINELLRTIDAD